MLWEQIATSASGTFRIVVAEADTKRDDRTIGFASETYLKPISCELAFAFVHNLCVYVSNAYVLEDEFRTDTLYRTDPEVMAVWCNMLLFIYATQLPYAREHRSIYRKGIASRSGNTG